MQKQILITIGYVILFISCKDNIKIIKYPNGNIKSEVSLNNKGLREGECIIYYESGVIKRKSIYVNDTLNGNVDEYYPNGKIHYQSGFKNSKQDGDFFEYFEDGVLKQKSHYKMGMQDGEFLFYYHNKTLSMKTYFKNDTGYYYQEFDSLGNITDKQHKILFSLLSTLNSQDSIKIKAEIRGIKNERVSTLIFDPNSNEEKIGDNMKKVNDSLYIYTFSPKKPSKYVILVNFLKDQKYRNDFDTLITIQ
jgi:antitoxin component YwqK of YwqJK toxin-antitoxin module